MSTFINTIDVVGDQALIDSIIDRSITEYHDDHISTIGSLAFHQCSNLASVRIPNATSIKPNAFNRCVALENIEVPEVIEIGNFAFNECNKLKQIALPKATAIPYMGFAQCKTLIKIDAHVASNVGEGALNFADSLAALILRKSDGVCTTVPSNFTHTPINGGTGYVYVPSALVDTYKADANWSTYAAQIRAIEDYPDICGD